MPLDAHQIQLCRAEACQARGSRALEDHAKNYLMSKNHQKNSDKKFSLDSVYCLGNCATGPNIRIHDELYGRVTNTKFEHIISTLSNME